MIKDPSDKVLVPIPFQVKALQEFKELSQSLGVSIPELISQALDILKMAQGRRLIVKEKDNDIDVWEITNYRNQEPILPLKGS